jgi:hypothetical protein
MALRLVERKARLETLLAGAPEMLRYSDHQIGRGPAFHRLACERGLEGTVWKRVNSRYEPDRRSSKDSAPHRRLKVSYACATRKQSLGSKPWWVRFQIPAAWLR